MAADHIEKLPYQKTATQEMQKVGKIHEHGNVVIILAGNCAKKK